MATTATTVRTGTGFADGARFQPPTPRRSWSLVGVGAVAALVGAVISGASALSLDKRTPVLALARTVDAGKAVTAPDLRVVRVAAAPSVQLVPAAHRNSIMGRVAAVPLPAGTLLSPAHLGSRPELTAAEATVGMALEPGRFPPTLRAGDRVAVIDAAAGTLAASSPDAPTGVVTSAEPVPAGGGVVVGLRLSRDAAGPVAAAATARRVALVLLPPA